MKHKLIQNILNEPAVVKPGQIWRLTNDIEFVISDCRYADSAGIVNGAVLAKINVKIDDNDILLNKKSYPETLPAGRVILAQTECPIPKEKLEFFIDNLTTSDIKNLKNALGRQESSYNEPPFEELKEIKKRMLPLIKTASVKLEKLNKNQLTKHDETAPVIVQIKNLKTIRKSQKHGNLRSYYRLAAESLENIIAIDTLWVNVENNKDKIVNLYEGIDLIVDFILMNDLPHLIFYSAVKANLSAVELKKGDRTAKAADENITIPKEGKFITPIEPAELVPGEWTLSFIINKHIKYIAIRIK